MSAVTRERREYIGVVPTARTAGELGYVLAAAVANYYAQKKREAEEEAKSLHRVTAEVLGELDFVAKEFYRHVSVPYEDGRITGNGPVFQVNAAEEGEDDAVFSSLFLAAIADVEEEALI